MVVIGQRKSAGHPRHCLGPMIEELSYPNSPLPVVGR